MDIDYTYNNPAFPGGIESEPAALETEKKMDQLSLLSIYNVILLGKT